MQNKLRLRYYPDEVLRKPTQKIKKFDTQLKKLADEMRELMFKEDGVGIAAPQIGLSIRLIICYNPDTKRAVAMCNPEIVKQEGQRKVSEGCLSFEGTFVEVLRPEKLVVTYHDINGVSRVTKAEGLFAQVIAHETEHLDSILLCDSQEKKFSGIKV